MTHRTEAPTHMAQQRAQAMVASWIHAEQFDTDRSAPAALALLITRALLCPCCQAMMLEELGRHEVSGSQLSKSLEVPDGSSVEAWHAQVNATYEALLPTIDAAPGRLN